MSRRSAFARLCGDRVARRFSPSQRKSALDLELPLLALDSTALARLIADHGIDVVVNCIGCLQDGPAATSLPCTAISSCGCCGRSAVAAAPSGSCISRSRRGD